MIEGAKSTSSANSNATCIGDQNHKSSSCWSVCVTVCHVCRGEPCVARRSHCKSRSSGGSGWSRLQQCPSETTDAKFESARRTKCCCEGVNCKKVTKLPPHKSKHDQNILLIVTDRACHKSQCVCSSYCWIDVTEGFHGFEGGGSYKHFLFGCFFREVSSNATTR